MPTDYSRWDKLTVSSDKEEEESQDKGSGAAASGANSRNSTPAAEQPSAMKEIRPCEHCHEFFPLDVFKFCSRCALAAYCSKDCQRKAWKYHKQQCVSKEDPSYHSFRAIRNLFELLFPHSEKKVFLSKCGRFVVDLSTIAKNQYRHFGKGILVMYFETRERCEDTATNFCLAVEGHRDSNGLPRPSMSYVPWPFDRAVDPKLAPVVQLLKTISIDAVMSMIQSDMYCLCMIIGDGAMHAKSIPYANPSGFGLTKASPAPLKASNLSSAFLQRLQSDVSFQECRRVMRLFNIGPGVLWLRNIFSLTHDYERQEFQKVTPTSLLKALQAQFKRNTKLRHNQRISLNKFAAFYSTLQGDTFDCISIKECFPKILQFHSDEVKDPNVLFGFFVTVTHRCSDSTIVTPFKIPMHESPI